MTTSSRVRPRAFRLVPYAEYDAVTNMAVDEALLDLHLQGKTPPTLRFYGWTPPAVSFGYGQIVPASTIERIKQAGYGVVRRPTGGRAVLHEGELTYCFIGSSRNESLDPATSIDFSPNTTGLPDDNSPYEAILDPSVAKAYRQICNALISGLTELGVETTMGKSVDGSYKSYHDCFQATTQADLQFQGKKIVGSAQLRRKHGVMQHGSLMLSQPQDKMAELLGDAAETKDKEAVKDSQRHFNLREILKQEVDRTTIEEAIGKGFTKAFDCRFAVYDINDEEWDVVKELMADENRYLVQTN